MTTPLWERRSTAEAHPLNSDVEEKVRGEVEEEGRDDEFALCSAVAEG